MGSSTTPDLFIIESLRFEDEESEHTEGKFLSHILKLAGRQVQYFYIRTRRELEEVLDRFEDSNFRYLHISCHANRNGVELTLDDLGVKELGQLLSPYLQTRRIFFSACEIATPRLAKALLKGTGCYSMIGPSEAVGFDEAALYWASLYHFLFKNEPASVTRAEIAVNMRNLSKVFRLGMKFYAAKHSEKNGYIEVDISGEDDVVPEPI